LRNKYVANVTTKYNDSRCWKSLLKIKDTYMVGRKINLKNGNICRLWKDSILDEIPFCIQFPNLFDLRMEKDCTIKEALYVNLVNHFRRTLRGDNLMH
jgi:hypothetical protein